MRNKSHLEKPVNTTAVLEHALGGENHTADTLANLNAKISDATLLDASKIIQSNPTSGQYRITGIRLDADKKIVITYDETPIA